MPLFCLTVAGRSTATQTMHDEKTLTAAEELENDRNVEHVFVTPAGEIRVDTNVSAAEPAEAGEALARWVDADITFSRASASGRLYFQVN